MDRIQDILHTLAIYEANGFLVLTYVLWEHLAGIMVLGGFLFFAWRSPSGQRVWTIGAGALAVLAAFLTPTPAPIILAAMSLAGVGAVLLDRFNPDTACAGA